MTTREAGRPGDLGRISPALEETGVWPELELDVSVVVPVASADAELREVVEALGGELDREKRSWEAIFVFDGVAGRAWEDVQKLRRDYPGRVRSITFKNPFGEAVCLSAAV